MVKKITLISSILLLVVFLIIKIISTANKKAATESHLASLPSFQFETLRGKPFNENSIKKNQPTIFIYFKTGCEHCQYETQQILQQQENLRHANVLMISSQSIAEIQTFDSAYQIYAHPYITLLRDGVGGFHQLFGTVMVPSAFVYTKQGRFSARFLGETKIENLIQAAHE